MVVIVAVIFVSIMFAFASAVRCVLGRPAWDSAERLGGTRGFLNATMRQCGY